MALKRSIWQQRLSLSSQKIGIIVAMKQIIQNVRTGQVEQREVPLPACGAGEVLVATRASLISAGTEKMVMEFAGKSLLGKAQERPDLLQKVVQKVQRDGVIDALSAAFGKLEEPLPLGYSAAGEVVQVGSSLTAQFKVGDRVAVAGAGLANHAQLNAVPKNLVVKLPKQVEYAEGCYATLCAIALHGVRNAEVTLGSRVLVVGLGLVGQLASQLALAAGARVAALDPNPSRVMLAKQLGAQWAMGPQALAAGWAEFTEGRGFDAVLLCAASPSDALLQQAAEVARDRANVVLVGKVGTRFDYASYMKKELNVKVSRSYGPGRYDPNYEAKGETYPAGFVPFTERDNLADAVRLMGEGKLNVKALTTHTFAFNEALKAYDLIGDKKASGSSLGVVLAYPDVTVAEMQPAPQGTEKPMKGMLGVSVLGSGGFARSVLIPKLMKNGHVALRGIISKGGLSAAHVQGKFNAAFASSDAKRIFDDKATQAVIIATRHNAHARQVVEALNNGKHVWVEKPLALNAVELKNIEGALAKHKTPPILMVGFNRRFAPALLPLKAKLDKAGGAKQVLVRVNPGRVEGWVQDAEGGGRLLGEVCHFTDVALWLLGDERVEHYSIQRGAGQDDYSISLRTTGGHLATIVYASEGAAAGPKEYVEVFGGGGMGRMENHTRTTWQAGGRLSILYKKRIWKGMDKGHGGALAAWVAACRGGKKSAQSLTPVADLLASSQLIVDLAAALGHANTMTKEKTK
jgi:2-desacetyl-2-hydroxyethyl bacteriochlorophyllide A dehydrogenase